MAPCGRCPWRGEEGREGREDPTADGLERHTRTPHEYLGLVRKQKVGLDPEFFSETVWPARIVQRSVVLSFAIHSPGLCACQPLLYARLV